MRGSYFDSAMALPTSNMLPTASPVPAVAVGRGQGMTEEQVEVLRRQISVYASICHQLVEMHRASTMNAQAPLPGVAANGSSPFDVTNGKVSGRQRWTPSQTQLQILERLFAEGGGTPNKQRIKAITSELSQHGAIQETKVYNWFQNRKARAKRKTPATTNEELSDADRDDDNSHPKKKQRMDSCSQENFNSVFCSDASGSQGFGS